MLRLLCACVLLSSFTGCYYSVTMEDPEAISKLGQPRSEWSMDFSDGRRSRITDLTVTVGNRTYSSTVKGSVKEDLDGRRLIWIDADDNQHQLTANEVIPYVVHTTREVIPGDEVSAPTPLPAAVVSTE